MASDEHKTNVQNLRLLISEERSSRIEGTTKAILDKAEAVSSLNLSRSQRYNNVIIQTLQAILDRFKDVGDEKKDEPKPDPRKSGKIPTLDEIKAKIERLKSINESLSETLPEELIEVLSTIINDLFKLNIQIKKGQPLNAQGIEATKSFLENEKILLTHILTLLSSSDTKPKNSRRFFSKLFNDVSSNNLFIVIKQLDDPITKRLFSDRMKMIGRMINLLDSIIPEKKAYKTSEGAKISLENIKSLVASFPPKNVPKPKLHNLLQFLMSEIVDTMNSMENTILNSTIEKPILFEDEKGKIETTDGIQQYIDARLNFSQKLRYFLSLYVMNKNEVSTANEIIEEIKHLHNSKLAEHLKSLKISTNYIERYTNSQSLMQTNIQMIINAIQNTQKEETKSDYPSPDTDNTSSSSEKETPSKPKKTDLEIFLHRAGVFNNKIQKYIVMIEKIEKEDHSFKDEMDEMAARIKSYTNEKQVISEVKKARNMLKRLVANMERISRITKQKQFAEDLERNRHNIIDILNKLEYNETEMSSIQQLYTRIEGTISLKTFNSQVDTGISRVVAAIETLDEVANNKNWRNIEALKVRFAGYVSIMKKYAAWGYERVDDLKLYYQMNIEFNEKIQVIVTKLKKPE